MQATLYFLFKRTESVQRYQESRVPSLLAMHCVRGLSRMRTWQLQSILAICFAAVTFSAGWDVSESNIPSRAWETDGWARTFYTLTYEHHMQQKARDKLEPETVSATVCHNSSDHTIA